MGVRGLTTYVQTNQNLFFRDHYLHDTCLVIDGPSLCSQLFQRMNSFCAFGGDYDRFYCYAKTFFKSLKKCKIRPYVLLDGGYASRKLKTVFSRLRSKIKTASRIDPVTQNSLSIFPILIVSVFQEVLRDAGVPFTICEFEADDEIAITARFLNCPVLSYDSDFFIYNVQYIPFNTLNRKPEVIEENGNQFHAMRCEIFTVKQFICHFQGMTADVLPLLATLLGNDYVQKRVFKKFFSHLKLSKSKTKNDQQRSIQSLLKWLQNETLDSAINKIIGRIRKEKKKMVLHTINKGIAAYNRKRCLSLKYFDLHSGAETDEIETDSTFPEEVDENEGADECDSEESEESDASNEDEKEDDETENVPEWFSEATRNLLIPQPYLRIYTLHLDLLRPQMEDYNADDASKCTWSIIKYAFDILTDFTNQQFVYVSREKDCDYKKIILGEGYSIPRPIDTEFKDATVNEKRIYFEHFIKNKLDNFDMCSLNQFPSNFRLIMLSIVWWAKHCQISYNHLYSILLSYVMLDIIDERIGGMRGHYFFNKNNAAKLQKFKQRCCPSTEIDIKLNKDKVIYEDCMVAASTLLQYFEMNDAIRKKPRSFDPKLIHKFAEYQCCLFQLNCLNGLCGEYFEPTKVSKSLNGTFVYNVAAKLEGNINPAGFLSEHMAGAYSVIAFFNNLFKEVQCILSVQRLNVTDSVKTSKTRRGGRKKAGTEIDSISFICKNFESEVNI